MKRLVKRKSVYKLVSVFVFVITSSFSEMEYESVADGITGKTIKRLNQEKQLRVMGIGGGMMGDIYKMSISFQLLHSVTQMEARQLLVDAIDVYLQEINNDKTIRPYLHNYPFRVEDIQIDIWVKNPDGFDVTSDQISYVIAIDGMLEYSIPRIPGNYKRNVLHEETYAEAVRILQDQREGAKGSVKDIENEKTG